MPPARGSLAAIPNPPKTFLLGNMLALGATTPVQDMVKLAREHGPIYWLDMRGRVVVVVSSYELVRELCDETRFDKSVRGALKKVRNFGGDGLFTAYTHEPNWSRAHNILLPNFGQRAMQGYHPMMLDIAEQLVLKWDRLNAEDEIDVVHDMTALTLDTIGLCGFDYRFNSFYRDRYHPFVEAIVGALSGSMEQLRRLPLEDLIRKNEDRKIRADIKFMNDMVDRIIQERRENGEDLASKPDLLSYMLSGVDRKSGERLDDLNIRYQIITFLIAGHETTSGLLSFAIHALLQNPHVLARAVEEVDRVLGPDPSVSPTYAQVNRLTYIGQILKETLRLWPTAPVFALYPYKDTMIGEKYKLKKPYQVMVLLPMLHRDPAVWGERAEVFDPDNFTREAESARPADAYKPFGNGQRACIGRQFALQEATLVLGMILQRFRLVDHRRYQLKIKESLTIKPDEFRIRVRRRTDRERAAVTSSASALAVAAAPRAEVSARAVAAGPAAPGDAPRHGTPLLVLYGSNLGTAEELARRMGADADAAGFATTVAALDDHVDRLPREGAVVITTASYNGTPPDNAMKFCEWLRSGLGADALRGVRYAVFGCGNQDWAATFQAIPRLIDARLAECGAERITARGEGDARDDFDGQFQRWYRPLWSTVATALGVDLGAAPARTREALYEVEVVPAERASPFVASLGARPMRVAVNRELHCTTGAHASDRSARHLELELPGDVSYRAGDHLGVVARNPESLVRRAAARFGLAPETHVRLRATAGRKVFLPVDEPVAVGELLGRFVELQDVATRSQIQALVEHTACPPERQALAALAGEDEASAARYKAEVLATRTSLLDLLERAPACTISFGAFLELLSPLQPRYYSIASSPLRAPSRVSITVGVVESPARSGQGTYQGVCSTHLRDQAEGTLVHAFVKDTKTAFRLPEDHRLPVIMIGPGTGLAPFRGFLQERAALKAMGAPVGPSMLFFGCRHPEQDYIYADELADFAARGVTELECGFSRVPGQPRTYVQDRLRARAAEVWRLLLEGAVVYVCGDASRMAPDVRRAFAQIHRDQTGGDAAAAERWLDELTAQGRYLVDVWAAS
jgi:cytochrome P450/NADPH-cytochrome P450 reductase